MLWFHWTQRGREDHHHQNLGDLAEAEFREARVCGFTVGWQNTHIRPLIGYVPDFLGAYDDMLVREYLQFFASCYGITGSRRTQVVDDALSLTDLGGKAEAPISGLSRGMSQRLAVARVLLHDPEVLLLDEPASGLDPRARVEMRELLRTLRDLGKTILISSHILHELAELCTSVGILERGKLVFAGSVQSALDAARSGTRLECELDGGMDTALSLLGALGGVRSVAVDEGAKVAWWFIWKPEPRWMLQASTHVWSPLGFGFADSPPRELTLKPLL